MKKNKRSRTRDFGFPKRAVWRRYLIGASLLVFGAQLKAADTNAPALLKPEQQFEGGDKAYNNWIEFSTGGFLTDGARGPAEKREQLNRGVFGGIEDLHYQKALTNGTTVTIDGRSIFDNHDYNLQIGVTREKLGYLRVGVENFRTWDTGTGGSFNADGLHYSLGNDGLAL